MPEQLTSANFSFLAAHDPQLVRLGALAERYFKDDPTTSLIKLRQYGETLAQLDGIEGAEGGEVVFELEGQFDGGDLFGVAMGEVGDFAFADVGTVAVGLPEVDGLIGSAVGGGPGGARYVHVHIILRES